jgi:hypothetical protein
LARADAVRRLGDEPGVLLELGDERTVDTAALYAALVSRGRLSLPA